MQRGMSAGRSGWPSRYEIAAAKARAEAPRVDTKDKKKESHRSRSPKRQTTAGRRDAPPIRQLRGHGKLPADLAASDGRQQALNFLKNEFYAPSNRAVMDAKLRTVSRALAFWSMPLEPPAVDKFHALGAALKAGGYRSASTYFSVYRGYLERAGFDLTSAELRSIQDATRSCERGVGGPMKAQALPFERLHQLPASRQAWAPHGPMSPRNAVVAGSWFLMREAELSMALASSITLSRAGGSLKVTWHLPASKTDPQALGTSRSHGCSCPSAGPASVSCPVHVLWDQLLFLQRSFPQRFKGRRNDFNVSTPNAELALFPDMHGKICEKEGVVQTILEAGRRLGVEATGGERLSGHSLRATGAQGLARLGVDMWAIQLLGRWGSDAVKGYVRAAHLDRASEWASAAAKRTELETIVKEIIEKLPQTSSTTWSRSSSSSSPWSGSLTRGPGEADQEQDLGLWAKKISQPSNLVETLLQPALAEEASLSAGGRSGEAGTPKPAPEAFAMSGAGVWHLVVKGPPEFLISEWSAKCGWAFGACKATKLGSLADVTIDHRKICQRCLPDLREAIKQDLVNAVKEQ